MSKLYNFNPDNEDGSKSRVPRGTWILVPAINDIVDQLLEVANNLGDKDEAANTLSQVREALALAGTQLDEERGRKRWGVAILLQCTMRVQALIIEELEDTDQRSSWGIVLKMMRRKLESLHREVSVSWNYSLPVR